MDTNLLPPAPETTLKPAAPGASRPILSQASRHPLHLLWICVLPQLLLLLFNLRSFAVVWGEMEEAQRMTGRWLLGAEIAMMTGAGALAFTLHRLRKPVVWALHLPLLAAAIGYLGFALVASGTMIPSSVSLWILRPEDFLYYQFAFVMPMAFYALLQLACFQSNRSLWAEIGICLAMFVGLPLIVGGGVTALSMIPGARELSGFVATALFLCGTVFAVGALLRLTARAYVGMRRRSPESLANLTVIVALAAPIGGLLLNKLIPFPVDFQSPGVYALTVLNGFVLSLPNFRSVRLHRAVWFAQCLLFPFTLYFFVVFLPFLPLSLLAMVVFGAGFLILAPTALFLLHGERILDGYRNEIRDGGRLIPAMLGIAAVLAIPALYTANALVDRRVLGRAIDYAWSPDYRAGGFSGNTATVSRTLESLRDFKAGIELPFLSDYYKWLVFDGLALPDEKMEHLHRLFLGRALLEPSRRVGESFFPGQGLRGRGRGSFFESRGERPLPPQDVRIERIAPVTESEDVETERTRVTLTLRNEAAGIAEFVTGIHAPEGVLVSGFWLHIGAERVPGRIFEKKTALWVYQKIRDVTRRDPGLLLYAGADTLELRVYPFAPGETRTVELEFLRPKVAAASVQIGTETIRLGADGEAPRIVLSPAGEHGAALTVPTGALAGLPAALRRPYLHFLIDRSASSMLEGAALRDELLRIAKQFPAAEQCAVTAWNFDSAELTDGLIPVAALSSWDPRRLDALPKRGGFAQDRALKRALIRAGDDLHSGGPAALGRFPVPIVIRSRETQPVTETDLEEFGKLAPDLGGYFFCFGGGELFPSGWAALKAPDSAARFNPAQAPRPVTLFKLGSAVVPVAADGATSALVALPGGEGELQAWDPAAGAWKAAPHVMLPVDSRYARGAGAWLEHAELLRQPALGKDALRRLVGLSRETGVIVPATSYIVVENSAQWRTLENTEKKKLDANGALELQETPEPGSALLLTCGGAALLSRRMRRIVHR